MKIVCDSCATKYSISDDKVRGKVFKIRCKKCSHIIVVRGNETASAAAPAAPAAAVEGGGWHLVVDGDQVGPISDADVRGRIERGEINSETYVWKEGFADWDYRWEYRQSDNGAIFCRWLDRLRLHSGFGPLIAVAQLALCSIYSGKESVCIFLVRSLS